MNTTVKNRAIPLREDRFLANLLASHENARRIKCSPNIPEDVKNGVVSLYETLVPRKELKEMSLEVIKKTFPTFEDIDVDMILEQAFPRFEKTIGKVNFEKVKRYFGIGCKSNKRCKDIDSLLSKLRTIENAKHYISGYNDLLSKVADLIDSCEEYTEIVKAKIVRMYSTIFFGGLYFVEDCAYSYTGKDKKVIVNYPKAGENNKMGFYPEELYVLFLSKLTNIPEGNLLYNSIVFEFNNIEDEQLTKEILGFAELDIKDGKFVSINKANPYQTFSKVRNIKQKVHTECPEWPLELFSVKSVAETTDLGFLYFIYKELKTNDLTELKTVQRTFDTFEGSRLVQTNYIGYAIAPDIYIGGEKEKERFIRLLESFASSGYTMTLTHNLKTGKKLDNPKQYNMGQFLKAIKFVNDADLIGKTDKDDFQIADKLIEMDKEGSLIRYSSTDLSISDIKSSLGIDEKFEFAFFGIKPKLDHKKVLSNFAIKQGFVNNKDEIDQDLIKDLLISGNEEIIELYNDGELGEEEFQKKLCITQEFAKMFFNLSSIDSTLIEEKLLNEKKSTLRGEKINESLKGVISLYCYLVEGQIPCGARMRKIKPKKTLKTSILRSLISNIEEK